MYCTWPNDPLPYIDPSTTQTLPTGPMSRTSLAAASGSSSSFHTIFCDALKKYRDKTKNDLVLHPLIADLQNCNLPSEIPAVLDKKYNVQEYIQSQSGDNTSEQWLNATFTVVASFSAALGEGLGLVFPPAKVIFAGIGVLLIAAKDVNASKDALVDIFGRIENLFKRLEIYTKVPPTDAMKELIVRIMVQVLEILAVATKEIKQQFAKKFMKKLVGRTDLEDALKKLDKLTHEEALMAGAEAVKIGKSIDEKMDRVIDGGNEARVAMQRIENDLGGLNRGQSRENCQKWLSPPDPSINFNTARKAYHDGTAAWFTRCVTFNRWKADGSENLLWIHGKPGSGKSILSSAIIEHLRPVSDARASYLGYFFFDFKDTAKQDNRALLSSLLIQLSAQSNSCFDALFDIYSKHDRGSQQPSEGALLQCLKKMLITLGQAPIYLIVDALDECPTTSKGLGAPLSRQEVLEVVKELVELHLPNLHICITSRPEVDIRNVVEQLACLRESLHDQDGQKEDIATYVRSVVYSDKYQATKWSGEVKERVVETLSIKADGM
ncbi:hypothetical protein BJV78DRAFT_789652 [Lactifluus subvellereus]|nr:hypothetical protein BJV78DRAFT_789652 [Lactifluus subvellereus]